MAKPGWGGKQGLLMGMDRSEAPLLRNDSTVPKEKFPPLKRPPLPLPKERDEYGLMLMQNYIDYFQNSK